MKKPIGWQIVHSESDDPPPGMSTYEVYPLEVVVEWFACLTDEHKPYWRCIPIFDGDVQEPVMMGAGA